MKSSMLIACMVSAVCTAFAQSTPTQNAVVANSATATKVEDNAATQAQVQQSAQQEMKVAPGSVLRVWKGKNVLDAELCSLVDSGKEFSDLAADGDEAARKVRERVLKWSGILNFQQAGLYTFNGTTYCGRGEPTAELLINGVSIFKFEGSGTKSKNVQIPGPVNVEIVIYNNLRSHREEMKLSLRYKKAGAISYKQIIPADLFHGVE